MCIPCAEWCAWSNTESRYAGTQCLWAPRAQNDVLEATLSLGTQAHSAYEHPVRRMMCLKQHWVSVRRHTVLMSTPCAEWCAWSYTESRYAGTQCLWAPRAQNDVLEATLSLGTQAHSSYEHPVRRMMCLKLHWVSVRRHTVLMSTPCAEWCAWSNTESRYAGTQFLWAPRAQNDVLEATLSLGTQAHSAYEHPVRRMMCLKLHWVSVRRHTVLMSTPCAEWCAWSYTESRYAGTQCLWAPRAQNDVLEAILSQRAGTALRSPHKEVQSTKERDINA